MVMEAPPSPQSVGREFVRQYYTLLNKAPTHLHRFYNHQSAFIHGGLDPNRETVPFVGQKQIHQKIQQLNFRDCHAKITQVDSQSTLGGGVVVQVTGELSNAGQPMRRFTQTFVLASQSPKKYYVHNDIFRYQDEIITDEDCDGDIRCEVNEECLERSSSITEPQTQSLGQPILPAAPGLPFYSGSTVVPPPPTAAAGGNLPSINSQQPSVTAPHQPPHNILPPSQQQQQQQPQINNPPPQSAATATLNGHPEDLSMLQSHLPQTVQQQQQPLSAPIPSLPTQVIQNQPTVVPTTVDVLQEENEIRNEEPIIEGGYGDVAETEQEQEIPQEPASNEPKTYANLLKNTSGGGQSQVTYQSPPQATTASTVPSSATSSYRTHSPPNNSHRGPQMNGIGNSNNRTGNNGPRLSSQGPPQTTRGGPSNNSHNRGGPRTGGDDNIDDEQRRRRSQSSNFGQLDANQLFLGNLPHSATEDELKEIFSEFGTVLDLRVHSKPPGMGLKPNQGGRAPPNYGFITYDTQASVMACLAAKPIFYPKNDSTGTQMNVEEKKNKDSGGRPSYGGNGGRQGLDNNRSGGRGDGPRRGGGGGGMGGLGGPRGGSGGPQGQGDRNRTGGDRDNNNRYNRSGGGGSSFRGGQNNYNRR